MHVVPGLSSAFSTAQDPYSGKSCVHSYDGSFHLNPCNESKSSQTFQRLTNLNLQVCLEGCLLGVKMMLTTTTSLSWWRMLCKRKKTFIYMGETKTCISFSTTEIWFETNPKQADHCFSHKFELCFPLSCSMLLWMVHFLESGQVTMLGFGTVRTHLQWAGIVRFLSVVLCKSLLLGRRFCKLLIWGPFSTQGLLIAICSIIVS